jgi:hypothetical protein
LAFALAFAFAFAFAFALAFAFAFAFAFALAFALAFGSAGDRPVGPVRVRNGQCRIRRGPSMAGWEDFPGEPVPVTVTLTRHPRRVTRRPVTRDP